MYALVNYFLITQKILPHFMTQTLTLFLMFSDFNIFILVNLSMVSSFSILLSLCLHFQHANEGNESNDETKDDTSEN